MSRLHDLARRIVTGSLASLSVASTSDAAPTLDAAPPAPEPNAKELHWSSKPDLSKKLVLRLNVEGSVDAISHRSHRSHSSHRSHYSSRSSHSSHRSHYSSRSAPAPAPTPTPRYSQPSYSTPRTLGSRTLQRGSVGTDVADLIRRLQRHGRISRSYVSTSETYSSDVEAAVRSFQRSASLEADGVAGTETIRMLQLDPSQVTPPPPPSPVELGSRTLRFGMEGADVAELIRLLVAGGHLSGTTTGSRFTAQVDAAVKSFQRARGVEGDGVVGPETLLLIKSDAASSTQSGDAGGAGAASIARLASGSEAPEADGGGPLDGPVPVAVAVGLTALYLRRRSQREDDEL